MSKILIATPLKGDISPEYFKLLFSVVGQRKPDTKIFYTFVGGTTVQWARDDIVVTARGLGFMGDDKIVSIDADIEPTCEQVQRLFSHNEEVVIGLYSKRSLLTHFHVTGKQGSVEREDGLMEVEKGAIGFSAIKMSAYDKIAAKYPERQYWKQDGGEEPVKGMFEYYPMGIVGPNSHVGKLERIRAIVNRPKWDGQNYNNEFTEIIAVLNDADYSSNQIRGEDYYFCELLKGAGVPIYLDTNLIVPHRGETLFPIQTAMLLKMLDEPWRADEVRALQQGPKLVEEPIIST